jgi:hypothetical protein
MLDPVITDADPNVDDGTTDTSDATDTNAAPDRTEETSMPRWVRDVGWVLLGLQLVALLIFSAVQYGRFAESIDFANYSQAWWAIGHGHLNPVLSDLRVPFWRDNAEFILYPLSLLVPVYPHPVVLLWIQDIALVATELVVFGWIRMAIMGAGRRLSPGTGALLAVGAALALIADPWAYETTLFDFHFEPIAALFCVLVGYNLWAGRLRRLWWLVPLALVCHVLAGTYLVGVGLAGVLAGRPTRRAGAMVAAVGAAWFMLFSSVGAAGVNGAFVNRSYGYLVGPHQGRISPVAVVVGLFRHPTAAIHVAGSHWVVILAYLAVLGVMGVASPWGFGLALVVLAPNLLNASGLFLGYSTSFQSWPAMPFVFLGSVLILVRLAGAGDQGRRLAAAVGAVWATVLVVLAGLALPTVARAWLYVSPAAAGELTQVRNLIPADAEVIVSAPVVGGFSQRNAVYPLQRAGQGFPVTRAVVVFVLGPALPTDGRAWRATLAATVDYVGHGLGAPVLSAGAGVHVFIWAPPDGTIRVTLP